jgi:methylated-DNA-[protein]-cysteine S-methyltransferase
MNNLKQTVWAEIKKIPFGQTLSYQQLATKIGKPKAVRAVASAVAANKKFYLIPCHRIIKSNGEIGEYRWGKTTKKILLITEKTIIKLYEKLK